MTSVPGAVATGSQPSENIVCQDVTRSLLLPVLTPSPQRLPLPVLTRCLENCGSANGINRERSDDINEFAVRGLQHQAVITGRSVRGDRDLKADCRIRHIERFVSYSFRVYYNER